MINQSFNELPAGDNKSKKHKIWREIVKNLPGGIETGIFYFGSKRYRPRQFLPF